MVKFELPTNRKLQKHDIIWYIYIYIYLIYTNYRICCSSYHNMSNLSNHNIYVVAK